MQTENAAIERTEAETVAWEVREGIAWVRFNRPEKRNCMSPKLNRQMMRVLDELEGREDVGVLVLSGEGTAWSAGMDLKEYFRENEAKGLGAVRAAQRESYGWWRRLRWYQKPTIAMVNGWCFGGGYGPLFACDLAFAAEEAQFGLSEINWGILPGGGATKVVRELVSYRRAMYHALTGETIDGRTAAEWGLVNEALPLAQLQGRVEQVCKVLLQKNAVALKATKDAIRRVGEMTYDNAEDYLVRAQEAANSFDSAGRKEAMKQFLDEKKFKPGLATYDKSQQGRQETVMADTRIEAGALGRLLKPRSVAIVGASSTPGALGASVIANLDRMGFAGEVHLVNPKRDRIGERPCLASADDLPMGVDVAVLAIPRVAVLSTLEALARRRVGAAIIFSAGFAEGGADGAGEQRRIAQLAAESGMVVEGPNCLGLVNYVDRVALTFVETPAAALGDRTGIGIVSQSGAMAAVLGVMLSSRDLGISYSVSTGNEAVSGVEDYVDYLLDDAHTRAVGMIVEHFRRPRRFMELARRARAAGKVIALLHPGRSSAARASARTHTGAMAGDYHVMRTLVERQGVLVVDNLEELGDVLEIAMRCRRLPSGGAAVLTESGAFKALTLDLCEQTGLPLPALDNDNAPALRAALPDFAPVSNPVDITAQGLVDPGLYGRVLAALARDERFGSIVLGIIQTDAATSRLKFPHIIEAIKQHQPTTPIIFAGLDEGAVVPGEYIAQLRALGVPSFPAPDRALRAVARLSALAARDAEVNVSAPLPLAVAAPHGVVPEYRCKELLGGLGVPFPAGRFVTTLEQAQRAAADIGFPVVLKAQSVQLSHKSDAGGVVLGLNDREALAAGWDRLHAGIARHLPDLRLDGVLVERMAPRGIELIIGARNDPDWGPVILAGFGGVQAEVLQDVRLLPPDLTGAGIMRELNLLKGAALLRGHRGTPEADIEAVAALIERLGRLMVAEPSIREIDLNPVIAYPRGQGALALDALMLVAA